jgi:hypothetical protein
VGPNLTYVGSLATLLRRPVLRARGADVGVIESTRLGAAPCRWSCRARCWRSGSCSPSLEVARDRGADRRGDLGGVRGCHPRPASGRNPSPLLHLTPAQVSWVVGGAATGRAAARAPGAPGDANRSGRTRSGRAGAGATVLVVARTAIAPASARPASDPPRRFVVDHAPARSSSSGPRPPRRSPRCRRSTGRPPSPGPLALGRPGAPEVS